MLAPRALAGACTRTGRCCLWVRYVLRPHPLTGHRVRGLRWRLITGRSRPVWELRGKPEPGGVRATWEWPG